MKHYLHRYIFLAVISSAVLISCEEEETSDEMQSVCTNQEVILTERAVISPVTNVSYLVDLTFNSFQNSTTKLKVNATDNTNQLTTIIEVENFDLSIGSQELGVNPIGKIKHGGYTFTTSYQPNGQSNFPIEPTGLLTISNYYQDCNSISGTVFIQAYTFSEALGEIRYSVKFDFENFALDDKQYEY